MNLKIVVNKLIFDKRQRYMLFRKNNFTFWNNYRVNEETSFFMLKYRNASKCNFNFQFYLHIAHLRDKTQKSKFKCGK